MTIPKQVNDVFVSVHQRLADGGATVRMDREGWLERVPIWSATGSYDRHPHAIDYHADYRMTEIAPGAYVCVTYYPDVMVRSGYGRARDHVTVCLSKSDVGWTHWVNAIIWREAYERLREIVSLIPKDALNTFGSDRVDLDHAMRLLSAMSRHASGTRPVRRTAHAPSRELSL